MSNSHSGVGRQCIDWSGPLLHKGKGLDYIRRHGPGCTMGPAIPVDSTAQLGVELSYIALIDKNAVIVPGCMASRREP